MREDVQNRDLTLAFALELGDVVGDRALDIQEPAILQNGDRERYNRFGRRHHLEGGGFCDRNLLALTGPEPTCDSESQIQQTFTLSVDDQLASGKQPALELPAEERFCLAEQLVC